MSDLSTTNEFGIFSDELVRIRNVRLDGTRVLLVDDSPDNRRLFQRILGGAGAIVELASDGQKAVRAVELGLNENSQSETYDVIVMDIRMPILDGYQATRLIRALGFSNPVIALTAHNTPGEERRCLDAGCSHFYLKPIDRLGLLKAIEVANPRRMVISP